MLPNGAQAKGGIRPRNEKVDGAVVDDLHDLLPHSGTKPVVDAGRGIQQNERRSVDRTSHHAPGVVADRRKGDA